ncbi:MAG TPA: MFS transporter [Candidatus Saccharimonadales bacterium]|nr:MFS transporter [Candidatus Saccharimonadales bacterium]
MAGGQSIQNSSKKGTNHWLVLVLLALAQFMVVLDVSIVNVALPAIQQAFHMSAASLQWVITAYSLTFGGFLLLGGRAADLFGRRKIFLLGISAFTIASLGSGLAQTGGMLIVFRALQGLAGAFMSPSALSIVLVTYREGHERNVALSVWGAVASGGAAVGVLAGGIITQYLTWRWNFFVNVPVGILVVFSALRVLDPHDSTADHNSLDLPGAISVTAGLMMLVYALVKAPFYGWTEHRSLTYFGISFALLLFFLINESRAKHPLMPLRIFRIRNLAGADSLMLCMAAGLFSIFFFTTLYLQEILGYTPIKTGVSFLVVPIAIAITATNVPRLIQRIGYRPILMVAPLIVSAGLFWISHLPVNGTFWGNVAPGMILLGLGMGATFVSVTIAATSGVPQHEAGLASGLLTTSQQIGGALGLAVLTGVATSSAARYILNLHLQVPPTHEMLATATVHGFHDGYLIASTFGIVASLIATFVIRNQPAKTDPSHAEAAPEMTPGVAH